ncbi:MAG: uroporphyrinogen decarboxylase family protein, partial [Candidatus Thermoplasmatota archaeon]
DIFPIDDLRSTRDYRLQVMPYVRELFDGLRDLDVPKIHFGTNTATLLPLMREAGGDIISVDWRIPIDEAWDRVGHDVAIQGNLDPAVLLAGPAEIEAQARDILERIDGRPGHVFNLGHGILPGTPVEHARLLVKRVHEWTSRGGGP